MLGPMRVDKKDYAKASFPVDLICLERDLAFDFLLKDIKAIAPEIMSEVDMGEQIEISFTSKEALIKAARKFKHLTVA
jgi:hypothetical protein